MGFWNKLGKIALQAAPYVAAPFTGGASLYAIPATQKLGEKWAASDAKKAAEKGLAPSKFDKYLGMASNVAGLASGTGALGKFGSAAYTGAKAASAGASAASKVGSTANKLSGWQSAIKAGGQTASMAMGGSPYAGDANYQNGPQVIEGQNGLGGWQGALATGIGGVIAANAGSSNGTTDRTGLGPSSSVPAEVTPRKSAVGDALNMGRQQAVNNQPFRAGYQTQIMDDDKLITHDMPPIYSDIRSQIVSPPVSESTPIANRFGDNLTPRRNARKRYPQQEVVEE